MSTKIGQIELDLLLNSKAFKTQLNNAVNNSLKSVSKTANGSLSSAFSKFGKIAIAAFSVKKIVQFGSECVKLGSDLAEVQNVVDVTFGSMSKDVDEFAKSAITNFGLSEKVAKEYMGTYGAMSKAFGYSTKEAYKMSEQVTALTGDVASFYNLSTDEAATKLKSIWTGETETLKSLGVVMTQNALDQFAMQKGFGKTTKSMTEQEKVALRLAFVTDKLSAASGDFARTADGWANQSRVLALRFEAIKASIGQGLINALTPALRLLNTLMAYLQKAADAFSNFTAKIFGKQEQTASASIVATEDLAGSVGDVGEAATDSAKAAKKAQNSLAGFDKLNVLGSKSSDTGAGGGGGGSIGSDASDVESPAEEAEKTAPLIDTISKKMSELKAQFSEGFKIGFQGTSLDNFKADIKSIKESIIGIFSDGAIVSSASGFLDKWALNLGKSVGAVSGVGVTIGEFITGSFKNYLSQNGSSIKQHIVNLFDISGEIADIVGNAHVAVADLFSVFRSAEAKQIGADLLNIFIEPLLTIKETILKLTRDIFNTLTAPFIENLDKIKLAFTNTLSSIQIVTGAISRTISDVCKSISDTYDTYIAPAFKNIKDGLSQIVGAVLDAYNKHIAPIVERLATKFGELWEKHLGPLAKEIFAFIGKTCELIGIIWKEFLAPFISWIVSKIVPAIAPIIEFIGNLLIGIGGTVADVIKGIMKTLGGLITFLSGVFSADWKKAWTGVKDIFKGIFDTLFSIVKVPLNLIIDGINKLISGLNKIKFDVPDWVPGVGGKTWGVNIPKIPKLAQGGYVEANTPQLAMIGDNRHEGEIVAPESKITEAVMEALSPIVETLKQLGVAIKAIASGNGQNIIVKCILDGKVVYETVVKQNNARYKQTGKSPLKV